MLISIKDPENARQSGSILGHQSAEAIPLSSQLSSEIQVRFDNAQVHEQNGALASVSVNYEIF